MDYKTRSVIIVIITQLQRKVFMKKLIAIVGLHLAFLSSSMLNASQQEAFKICACLAQPDSQGCADILFDSSDKEINANNLTVDARKKLSLFFKKATNQEVTDCEKQLEKEYGFQGKLSFSACRNISNDSSVNELDDLTALVIYRNTGRWISAHEEEAAIFFKRADVREIEQKIAKFSAHNPSNELAEILPKALSNELEKEMMRALYVQGKIGFFAYQWEMLKRW